MGKRDNFLKLFIIGDKNPEYAYILMRTTEPLKRLNHSELEWV